MFVKSKTGEINRRVAQCEKLVTSIAEKDKARAKAAADPSNTTNNDVNSRATLKARQSLVVRLRQEIVQLTRDVQHLARFIGVQRTGFRKLLKKYKKWAASTSDAASLGERFLPILEDPKSFTNQDLTPTFLELSLLYNVLRQAKATDSAAGIGSVTGVETKQVFPGNEKLCVFDCEMVTSISSSVTFWVHPDNIMETKIILLQNLSLVSDGSSNAAGTDAAAGSTPAAPVATAPAAAAADLSYTTYLDSKKFSAIQTSTEPGQIRNVVNQSSSAAASSTPILCSPVGGLRHFCLANLSTEQADMVLQSKFEPLAQSQRDMDNLSKMALSWVEKRQVAPIAKVQSCRSRFRYSEAAPDALNADSPASSPNTLMDAPDVWATIDSDIKITRQGATTLNWPTTTNNNTEPADTISFPHSVLEVRWKGLEKPVWVSDLESSHLVYPVTGFSLYAHAVAVFYPDALSALPKWFKLVQDKVDIRKTPKPKSCLKRTASKSAQSMTLSVQTLQAQESDGLLGSAAGRQKDYGSSSDENLAGLPDRPRVRYWNEFDDPEDGDPGFFVVIPSDDSDDGFFDEDKVAYLIALGETIAAKASAVKRKVLSWFGVKPASNYNKNRTLSIIYEEEDEDEEDDEFEGYYSRRPSKYARGGLPDLESGGSGYTSFPSQSHSYSALHLSAAEQRNYILTVFYSICFFLSALIVFTLLGAILGEDMSSISVGTYSFIICGLLIALSMAVLGMSLFLMRVDVPPPGWHQGLVFGVVFGIVCVGVGEMAWLFT